MNRFRNYLMVLTCSLVVALSAQAALRSGTDYRLQTDVTDQGGDRSTSSTYIIRQGSAGQLGAVGQSDSATYGAGQGYIYTTNTRPATPESLAQYKADGTTVIPHPAGWTYTSSEVFKMDISDPDPGDILTPQAEVVLTTESFTNTPDFTGSDYDYSGVTVNASLTATSMEHDKGYLWQVRTKDQENFYSDWATLGGSPGDFRVDLVPPTSPEVFIASAQPEPSPAYVTLTWEAGSDATSGVAGYDLYRSTTPGSGYVKVQPLLTGLTTSDVTVVLGTDYYYVIRTVDQAGGESEYSVQASAPYIIMTREATIIAPVSGGYSGAGSDPVPGSTIKYTLYYTNLGFAVSSNIIITDQVPEHTDFKMGSATGDGSPTVTYSNNNGSTFDYTPSGTHIDPSVTNLKWSCPNASSGITRRAEFSVVIR